MRPPPQKSRIELIEEQLVGLIEEKRPQREFAARRECGVQTGEVCHQQEDNGSTVSRLSSD